MSGKQIGKAYVRGCATTLGVGLVGGILGTVLVAFALFMAKDARPEDELRVQLIVAAFTLVMLAGVVGVAWWWIRHRGRKLDQGFAAQRVESAQVSPALRSWSGIVRGRPFNGWVAKGPRLELYLECSVGTRGAIRRVGPAIRTFGKLLDSRSRPVASPRGLEDCEVLCQDPAWMGRFLRRPGITRTAAQLMTPSERTLPGIHFGPASIGYIRQFLPLHEIDQGSIDGWLDQLSILADGVEAAGSSVQALEPSKLEEWSRKSRRLPIHPVVLAVGCSVLAIAAISLFAMAIALFLYLQQLSAPS